MGHSLSVKDCPVSRVDGDIDRVGEINRAVRIGGKKERWRLSSSDGREYILKKVRIPADRLSEFTEICAMGVSGFQKVVHIYDAQEKDFHYVLCRWQPGSVLNSDLPGPSDQRQYLIQKAAKKLRKIHTEYEQRGKVSIPENCVEKIVKQDFLAPEIQRLLLSYLIGKLPIVNSRNRTIVHGDVHTGNILITEDEDVVFIDLDHVRFGDPYMDLVYASNLIGSRTDRNTYYAFLKDYFETGIPGIFGRS